MTDLLFLWLLLQFPRLQFVLFQFVVVAVVSFIVIYFVFLFFSLSVSLPLVPELEKIYISFYCGALLRRNN